MPQPGTNASPLEPVVRLEFDAATLVSEHPPKLANANKKLVYSIACPAGVEHKGKITFSRWAEMQLPQKLSHFELECKAFPDIYKYSNTFEHATEWHVNFADASLFFGYGGPLFAQDEIQVAEHPALGSLREALKAKRVEFSPMADARPAPVLVANVQRRCAIKLTEIYGNRFSNASRAQLESAVKPLQPPNYSNLIAIVAPTFGSGEYSRKDIEFILATAYTGFRAAKLESERVGKGTRVVIHTGFWGCGAFGGNRQMMALLQLLAAKMSGVDTLVFHTFDNAGMQDFQKAETELRKLGADDELSDVIKHVIDLKLRWA